MSGGAAIAPPRLAHPWIQSAWFDGIAILAPAWLTGLAVLAFPAFFHSHAEVTPIWWLLLVVGVDVAHVYSTIFRTYLDRTELARRPLLYLGIPLVGWLAGVLLYSFGALTFWRCLAYLAVFHFMRQQYGFLMIYGRRDGSPPLWARRIDAMTISMTMLYPLLYWHSHLPQDFDWFVSGDFVALPSWVDAVGFAVYLLALAGFLGKEIWFWSNGAPLNLCRWLLVGGTAISWYCGIVVAQGDLAFTLTNVVAHGVPYTALIWIYRRNQDQQRRVARSLFTPAALPLYLGILVLLAYLEEGVWDGLVWREHLNLFLGAAWLPAIDATAILSWLVPLLALPQISHYLLDGFIWRFKAHPEWRHIMFPQISKQPS
jgi:hypothetical protein